MSNQTPSDTDQLDRDSAINALTDALEHAQEKGMSGVVVFVIDGDNLMTYAGGYVPLTSLCLSFGGFITSTTDMPPEEIIAGVQLGIDLETQTAPANSPLN